MLEFKGPLGNPNFTLYNNAKAMMLDGKTGSECIAAIDSNPYPTTGKISEAEDVIATVPVNMSILETSFYIADAYRAMTNSDIGLIVNNEVFRGNVMRVFAGDITSSFVAVLKPRSFANGATLIKVSMTGQQLLDALDHPFRYNDEISIGVYAYSGLKCEIAPWNEIGQKYLSVKLANGSSIEPDKLYTVGVWSGTVADQYAVQRMRRAHYPRRF